MAIESLGIVGGGQMAAAILAGVLRAELLTPKQIVVVESLATRRSTLQQQFPGVAVSSSFTDASQCSTIIIALKPQVLREVGVELGSQLRGKRLWISIAAGVSIAELSQMLDSNQIVRVMPNTPAQIGAGAAGITANASVTDQEHAWAEKLVSSIGICHRVTEQQLHAVTGISGSSPAYIYMIVEAMADGGVLGGLPRDVAIRLAAQSVMGAAKMVLETGMHPGQLKDQVTSPAGTTIAAIRKLEAAGIRSALIEAVHAATVRSQELEKS